VTKERKFNKVDTSFCDEAIFSLNKVKSAEPNCLSNLDYFRSNLFLFFTASQIRERAVTRLVVTCALVFCASTERKRQKFRISDLGRTKKCRLGPGRRRSSSLPTRLTNSGLPSRIIIQRRRCPFPEWRPSREKKKLRTRRR